MRLLPTACLLAAIFLHTGCRSYGGHGSEEAAYDQIQAFVAWADQEKQRLTADEGALAGAAGRVPMLEEFTGRMTDLSTAFTAQMGDWREQAGAASASEGYRSLHRTLGSLVTERQIYEDRYRRLAAEISTEMAGFVEARPPESRYQAVPVFYERFESRLDNRRIRDLLTDLG